MATINEHHAHEPYMAAVVAALHAAGLQVQDWWAETNDPRDAAIFLAAECTRPAHGDAEVVLCWNEEGGWFCGVSRPVDQGELRMLRSADLGVLPGPDAVATWASNVAADQDSGGSGQRMYREFDGQDAEFERQLRAFWPDDAVPASRTR